MIGRLRRQMKAAANPEKAAAMRAYMKSTMPYYGINMPDVRAISREVFDGSAMTCSEWRETILELWRGARYREERYAALFLLGTKAHRECVKPDLMPMLEELIVTGAWWDYVDEVAGVVGDLLRRYPKTIRPLMRRWSTDRSLWKRRVSSRWPSPARRAPGWSAAGLGWSVRPPRASRSTAFRPVSVRWPARASRRSASRSCSSP